MYQRHRQVLPDFDRNEPLYLRYGREDFVEGQLAPAAIRFPRTLVRGNLSEPEDALFAEDGKFNGLGVVAFEVSDIPPVIVQEQARPMRLSCATFLWLTTIRTARFGLTTLLRQATIGSRAGPSSSNSEFTYANESRRRVSESKPSGIGLPDRLDGN